jgi:ferredoxin
MPRALIVGSGPAAASVALALAGRTDIEITVIDIGAKLDDPQRDIVARLAAQDRTAWASADVARITAQPVAVEERGLPEKRAYGSDFPFRDVGQLRGVTADDDVQRTLISGAYGGFSNTWGAQITPFPEAALAMWPEAGRPSPGDYEAALARIPYAGEHDDLEAHLPLLGDPAPLPPPSSRTALVLDAYARRRAAVNQLGVSVGKARLAFDSAACVRCGLCMTGCPYSLIYSSASTFDALRASGRVTYHDGLLALSAGEIGGAPYVLAKELASGRVQRFDADRVFLACGAIGTTRLVMQSLQIFDEAVAVQEPAQFIIPFASMRPTPDPVAEPQFTLNQFNMLVALDDAGRALSQLHFYTYNPAFVDALPRVLRHRSAAPAVAQLLRRLCVTIGYLPSWESPHMYVTASASKNRPNDDPVPITLARERTEWRSNVMLRKVLARVARAGRHLDLWPLLPMMTMADGGKSYHWGGSFPHTTSPAGAHASDVLGRVGPWERTHLVDASVFPNVASTTYMLTIMANAYRIATAAFAHDR